MRSSRSIPADKEAFTSNADAYLGQLDKLESWVKSKVAELARDKRKLVTSHDAFQLFRAGLRIHHLSGRGSEHAR